jgi:indolepyruvate ferredoxin oxidoreductase beta subunit
MSKPITNVVFAGLGGQGILKASDILSQVAFEQGLSVKKSEIHGMSQRGGSVTSDVRFGEEVLSPMVPPGEADYLVVLAAEEVENNRRQLKSDGVLISPDAVPVDELPHARSLNVALLGVLSRYLPFTVEQWQAAIRSNLAPKLHEVNMQAFELGRRCAAK